MRRFLVSSATQRDCDAINHQLEILDRDHQGVMDIIKQHRAWLGEITTDRAHEELKTNSSGANPRKNILGVRTLCRNTSTLPPPSLHVLKLCWVRLWP